MPLDHALHNKRLYKELYEQHNQPFKDWIVTTAFYTSIHFVDARIFPFTYDGKEIKSIDGAHNNPGLRRNSRHSTRFDLVCNHLPDLRVEFKFLMDKCHNARYVNYKVSGDIVSTTNLFLEKIILNCTPKPTV